MDDDCAIVSELAVDCMVSKNPTIRKRKNKDEARKTESVTISHPKMEVLPVPTGPAVPVHRKPPIPTSTRTRKKTVAVDDDIPQQGNSAIVEETDSSNETSESKSLMDNIKRARRSSIKFYMTKVGQTVASTKPGSAPIYHPSSSSKARRSNPDAFKKQLEERIQDEGLKRSARLRERTPSPLVTAPAPSSGSLSKQPKPSRRQSTSMTVMSSGEKAYSTAPTTPNESKGGESVEGSNGSPLVLTIAEESDSDDKDGYPLSGGEPVDAEDAVTSSSSSVSAVTPFPGNQTTISESDNGLVPVIEEEQFITGPNEVLSKEAFYEREIKPIVIEEELAKQKRAAAELEKKTSQMLRADPDLNKSGPVGSSSHLSNIIEPRRTVKTVYDDDEKEDMKLLEDAVGMIADPNLQDDNDDLDLDFMKGTKSGVPYADDVVEAGSSTDLTSERSIEEMAPGVAANDVVPRSPTKVEEPEEEEDDCVVEENGTRLNQLLNSVLDREIEMLPNLDRPIEGDHVYFNVSTVNKEAPPEPFPKERKAEDSDLKYGLPGYIDLPWSTRHGCEGKMYTAVKQALQRLVQSGMRYITDIEWAMGMYANDTKGIFTAIRHYWAELSTDEERLENQQLICKIARLALRAEKVITQPLCVLHRGTDTTPAFGSASVTLSQEQCACLLANAFFCTFPNARRKLFNCFNMSGFFNMENPMAATKLKFIYHYFKLVTDKMPTGCVSFRRSRLSEYQLPNWKEQDNKTFHTLAVSDNSVIEECHKFLQMDFANKFIGGGVFNYGAVQEEIRFLICPEMMVSMLLCPVMKDDEAIFIAGAQRFSSYEGYAKSLKWKPFADYGSDDRDKYGRVMCELVAIDATYFSRRSFQFTEQSIRRELNKAYVGFHTKLKHSRPIATGNWGCGVFNGNRQLKSLIQLMAAGQAGRDLLYVPYDLTNQDRFGSHLNRVYMTLVQREVTIGQLYRILVSYRPYGTVSVFDYVMRETSLGRNQRRARNPSITY